MSPLLATVLWSLLKVVLIVVGFALTFGAVLTWVERKQSALIQNRVGPNRAAILGIRVFGLMHLVADAIKMFTKEDFNPTAANPVLFNLAPFLSFAVVLIAFAVVPFGPGDPFVIANLDSGILALFAVTSLGVYGNTIGAWASASKWSLLGGMRVAAQMISYEVALGLSLVGVFMVYGSVNLGEIVAGQGVLIGGWLPKWGIVTQPVAFLLFLTAAVAENKRAPFDVAEADSELVSGYFTEYSSLKFGAFFLSEFVAIVLNGALIAVCFFGGWQIPWVDVSAASPWWLQALGCAFFLGKVVFFVWLQMMIRWTLPRFRYDQVMNLGWRVLLPLGLANFALTAIALWLLRK